MKDAKIILVVDDEPEISSAVKRVLEKEGYQIYLAETVQECREFLKTENPDLILMDVVLPDGNGIDLANELSQDKIYGSIGILLMSGLKTDEIDRQMGLKAGALDFVTKPIQMHNLVQRIKLIFSVQQMENRRLELQKQYNHLFSNVSDLVFVLEKNGEIRSLSKSFERITEFRSREWIGKSFENLIFEKDKENWKQHFYEALNNRLQESFDISLMKNRLNFIPVNVVLSKIQKDNKNEDAILGILKDQSLNKFFESTGSNPETLEQEQMKREKSSWDEMSDSSTTFTQSTYEVSVFVNTETEIFQRFLAEYNKIVEKSIESRIFKIEHENSEERREFAGRLGNFKAGPRDLVRLNREFFINLDINIHPKKLSLYHEEARLILLELMGYLVSFYRNRNIN